MLGDERTASKHIAEEWTLQDALEHLNYKADPHLAAMIADLAAEFRLMVPVCLPAEKRREA